MNPFCDLNQPSPMPQVQGEDHDPDHHEQSHLHPFITAIPNDHSKISPPSCPSFIQYQTLDQDQKQESVNQFLIQEPRHFPASQSFPISQRSQHGWQQATDQDGDQLTSNKWMSSKMRIMRKMMSGDEDEISMKKPKSRKQRLPDHHDQEPADGAVVRVCSDCNTTKTPLWRSGPCGPKSLCNACGIRRRKVRRALAAAAAVSGGLIPAAAALNCSVRKEKESDGAERMVPFKKRCRFSSGGITTEFEIRKTKKMMKKNKKKLCFDDIVISVSKSAAFQRVFPQDEKDAAILLMALSCGLVCS